jgi:hypothetical protein
MILVSNTNVMTLTNAFIKETLVINTDTEGHTTISRLQMGLEAKRFY